MNALGMYKLELIACYTVNTNTQLQMTPMTSTRPLPQLLPQQHRPPRLRLLQTRTRSTPRLSKATLPKTLTPSKATLPKIHTLTRATHQRTPTLNRAILQLILTTSLRLCFLLMMRE